jgi:hypothetical protein
MGKLITSTMLTSAMGFTWKLIGTGERVVAAAESWGANDQHAGFAERRGQAVGMSIPAWGESLERGVNRAAMVLGLADGEVSGMVAWPALAP